MSFSIIAAPGGVIRHLINDAQPALAELGYVTTVWRNSHVETWRSLSEEARCVVRDRLGPWPKVAPDDWWVDLTPVGDTVHGPFARHAEAIAFEIEWLEKSNLPLEV